MFTSSWKVPPMTCWDRILGLSLFLCCTLMMWLFLLGAQFQPIATRVNTVVFAGYSLGLVSLWCFQQFLLGVSQCRFHLNSPVRDLCEFLTRPCPVRCAGPQCRLSLGLQSLCLCGSDTCVFWILAPALLSQRLSASRPAMSNRNVIHTTYVINIFWEPH